MIYKFEISGRAVPQGRPRLTTINGYPRAYDPPKSREYKERVRECAMRVKPLKPFDGALRLNVVEYREIPKSWSKVKRADALNHRIDPITKPDTDNILKGIKDALKGIFWNDDAQVVDDRIQKIYSDSPRVEVEVIEITRE